MKKIFTFLSLISFSALFSQITITANLPADIASLANFETEIKINKGPVSNFAKYQMDVPLGYMVTSVDVKGGNFTFENQRAKIVWVSVPSDPEFAIKFKIQANSDAANPGTFNQKFYYLDNNEKKEVEAVPIVVTIGGGNVAAVAAPSEPVKPSEPAKVAEPVKPVEPVAVAPVEPVAVAPVEPVKPVEPVAPVEPVKVAEPVAVAPVEPVKVAEPVAVAPVEPVKVVEPVKAPEPVAPSNARAKSTSNSSVAGMTYKVQLGAFSNEPNKSRFAKAGNVSVDLVNGLYKVTTGSFNTKEDAIKHLNELQGKGYTGFIAKYNDGKRIN